MAAHENRLIHETSPYLLQHAHNPVDWYPWGPEALERARREDKPILLSIGYAACHWCHVMERESFENEETARLMNEHFVNIKVDREERPDLDEIYMAATVAMSGSGGWPMTVFLTPDQRPFFAGTYFPPEDKYGRTGFPTLLRRIAELWQHDREALTSQAAELAAHLEERSRPALPAAAGEGAIEAAVAQLKMAFDRDHGGFGPAPKFPPSMSLELALRHHRRTGDAMSLTMVERTLDMMSRGGIYDHVGGGFARYSTDERWLVPHFEKMLYDNALLARVYTYAFQVTGNARYRRVTEETLDYILREMTSPQGGFYSATDADSEGVEGKFFVWTPEEVEAVLEPAAARAFCAYYDITPQGNWEGHSIPNTPRPIEEVAGELAMEPAELEKLVASARAKMYQARKERVPPLTDDKILTAWNALMLGSLAECGRALDEPRYRAAAARAADYLLATMRRPDGGLFRTARAGKVHLDGYLEDYAYLADALVDVYEAGLGTRYLEAARDLTERMIEDFADDDHGGFFTTAAGHEKLLVRPREGQDGPMPAANAVAARVLTRLAWHLGREAWRERAIEALRAHGQLIERAARAFAASLNVADMLLEGPVEAVLSAPDADSAAPLGAALGAIFLPNRIVVHLDPQRASLAPEELLAGKEPVNGAAALYVCRDFACERPVTDPEEVARALGADARAALRHRKKGLGRRLPGRATAEGTGRYAARRAGLATTELGRTGLVAARIGFGGYRVDDGTPIFGEALEAALTGGVNLVDTSTNYTNGGSERLIGATLGRLVARGELARDEIVVVSKIGYVQGDNLRLAKAQKAAGEPFAEMVEYMDGCWHCIHPSWLADQLDRSLDRLGLETLDVCLLHNPEYFLTDAAKRGPVTDEVRDAFYARMERAFSFFEEQVSQGRIGCYGVSSNTVAQRTDHPEATELLRMLRAAERAGGREHRFRVLQLPFNLLESGAALDAYLPGGRTVLAAAEEHGLAVLANRPLNAIDGEAMVRLAEPPEVPPAPRSYREQLALVSELERRFDAELATRIPLKSGLPVDELFRWGSALAPLDGQIGSLEQLEQVARGQIIPRVSQAIGAVERALPGSAREAWSAWRRDYIRAVEEALAALRAQVAGRARAQVQAIAERIEPVVGERSAEPLQRKALWILSSVPGIDAVLLGMRQPRYVEDALAVLSWPRLSDPAAALRELAGA